MRAENRANGPIPAHNASHVRQRWRLYRTQRRRQFGGGGPAWGLWTMAAGGRAVGGSGPGAFDSFLAVRLMVGRAEQGRGEWLPPPLFRDQFWRSGGGLTRRYTTGTIMVALMGARGCGRRSSRANLKRRADELLLPTGM